MVREKWLHNATHFGSRIWVCGCVTCKFMPIAFSQISVCLKSIAGLFVAATQVVNAVCGDTDYQNCELNFIPTDAAMPCLFPFNLKFACHGAKQTECIREL